MNDLPRRLRTVSGRTCIEAADALEKQQAEIERHIMEVDASRDRIEDLQEELTALKAQAAKDSAEIERLNQGWQAANKQLLQRSVDLSSSAALIAQPQDTCSLFSASEIRLKSQAAKDAANVGRLRGALRLYVKAGYGNSTNLAQQSEAYAAAIEAMKESQQ